jgi:hypothetical protein
MKINGNYSDLWKAIIRPDRQQYTYFGILIYTSKLIIIGDKMFEIGQRKFQREDI